MSLKRVGGLMLMLFVILGGAGAQPPLQKWTGDIPIVSSVHNEIRPALTCASDGTLYAAIENTGTKYVYLYQSTDGGKSWTYMNGWTGGISGPHNPALTYIEASDGEKWICLAIEIANSNTIRSVWVIRIDPDHPNNYTTVPVASNISMPSLQHIAPEICTDYPVVSSSPSVYITYAVYGADYYPAMFSRSTDLGLSWSTPINVTGAAENSDWQTTPDIAYGTGGLFIVFEKLGEKDGNWFTQIWITKSTDHGVSWNTPGRIAYYAGEAYHPRVAAAIGNESVFVAYTRNLYNAGNLDVAFSYTTGGGYGWGSGFLGDSASATEQAVELDRSLSGGNVHAVYWKDYTIMHRMAPITNLLSWSTATRISDVNYSASSISPKPALCINPTRMAEEEAGIAWADCRGSDDDVYFDAGYLSSNSYLLWTK